MKYVYVVEAERTPGAVKIGCTSNPWFRVAMMDIPSAIKFPHDGPYSLYGHLYGDYLVEAIAKVMLAEHRASKHPEGEWFHVPADDALLTLMRAKRVAHCTRSLTADKISWMSAPLRRKFLSAAVEEAGDCDSYYRSWNDTPAVRFGYAA